MSWQGLHLTVAEQRSKTQKSKMILSKDTCKDRGISWGQKQHWIGDRFHS